MVLSEIEKILSNLHTNEISSAVMYLLIVLYAVLARPTLPPIIKNLFNNEIFRIIVLALVVYRGNKNPAFALTIAVSFVMVLNKLNEEKLKEEFKV